MDNQDNNKKVNDNVTKTIKFKRSSLSEKIKNDSAGEEKDVTKTIRFKRSVKSDKPEIKLSSVKETDETSGETKSKTVKFKPRFQNQKDGQSSAAVNIKEKVIVEKDAGVLRTSLNKEDKPQVGLGLEGAFEKLAVNNTNAVEAGDNSTIEKTLKLKRPDSNLTVANSSQMKPEQKYVSVEKTLRLKRPESNSMNIPERKKQDGKVSLEKTLKLKRPDISVPKASHDLGDEHKKNHETQQSVEKTLKLKRPNLTDETSRVQSSHTEKKISVPIEKTLKLKRPGLIGSLSVNQEKDERKVPETVEKTLKLKRPSLTGGDNSKTGDNNVQTSDASERMAEIAQEKKDLSKGKSGLKFTLPNHNQTNIKKDEAVIDDNSSIAGDIDIASDKENSVQIKPKVGLKLSGDKNTSFTERTAQIGGLKNSSKDSNIKIPPLPIKTKNNNTQQDSSGEENKNNTISDELNLELEAALDALSVDDVKFENTKTMPEKSQSLGLDKDEEIKEEIGEEVGDIADIDDFEVLEDVDVIEKQKSEYGGIYLAVSCLTLIGLICFLYVSFQSLKLF